MFANDGLDIGEAKTVCSKIGEADNECSQIGEADTWPHLWRFKIGKCNSLPDTASPKIHASC